MAHGNRFDDSFSDLPPIRTVQSVQAIAEPRYSDISLGAFTGEAFAVCSFESPLKPALVAFNYADGSIRWSSNVNDFPPHDRQRWVAGILMAKLVVPGRPAERRIFASNPREFIAYDERGAVVWKRAASELVPESRDGPGILRSFSYTSDHALVICTNAGWIIKVDPVDGALVDSYRMVGSAAIGGRLCRGHFSTVQSPVIIGNILYIAARFEPEASAAIARPDHPIFIVRLDVSGRKIKALCEPRSPSDTPPDRVQIGVSGMRRFGGSPCGMIGRDGAPIIVANAQVRHGEGYCSIIAAVTDRNGALVPKWHSTLAATPGEVVPAAPALYSRTGLYLVQTMSGLHVFRDVDSLSGGVAPTALIIAERLVTPAVREHAASVALTSPIALAFDSNTNQLVAYTNVHIRQSHGGPEFAFVSAFALSPETSADPQPLWCEPLACTPQGVPLPGPGSYGQPALFRYDTRSGPATGLVVTTYHRGTVIFR
jgi:hypothetical protein